MPELGITVSVGEKGEDECGEALKDSAGRGKIHHSYIQRSCCLGWRMRKRGEREEEEEMGVSLGSHNAHHTQ